MKAVTFQGPFQVEVKDLPDPAIKEPADAILRVTSAAVCGSDLHVYTGRLPMPYRGWTMGHEYVGEVVEVGDAVSGLQPGDRVVGPPVTSCGECFYCRRRWSSQCPQQRHFGFGQLEGAQAEYLRVPHADTTLEVIPGCLGDEKALPAGDALATGYFCAERGDIGAGDVVVVVGAGSVGLCALMCLPTFRPGAVLAIDSLPERLALAERLGAVPVDLSAGDPVAVVRDYTEGRGADVVLEAVGSADSLRSCFRLVRPGGTISAAGVYAETEFPFPMFQAYVRDLTFKIGACPVKSYMGKLLAMIEAGKIDPSILFTHTLALSDAALAYDIFAHRKDGCIKVLLKP